MGKQPIEVQKPYTSAPPNFKIEQAARIISQAKCPIILAGNGVIRAGASESLVTFAEVLHIPVATTFMAKGAIPFSHELSLGTVGLKAKDWVSFGFEKANVVICVGYDMVEYHPEQWNPDCCKSIVHIDVSPPKSMSTTSSKWACWVIWEKRCARLLGKRDRRKAMPLDRCARRLFAR